MYCNYYSNRIGNIDALAFNVYPNPTTGKITIESTEQFIINNLTVVDQKGGIVLKSDTINQNNQILDISGLAKGLYIININYNTNKQYSRQVLVE